MRLAIGKPLLAGFGLGLGVFVMLGIVSYRSEGQFAEMAGWVQHTHEVLARIQKVNADLIGVQSAVGGFVITGSEDFLAPYRELLPVLEDDERTLRRLTADNPSQQARLTTLDGIIRQRLAFADETLDFQRRAGLAAAASLISTGRGQESMKRFALVIGALLREEQDLLTRREARARSQTTKTFFILSVGTVIGISLLLAVLFLLNSEAAERHEAQAASRLAAEIVRATGDALITKTLKGIITSWNPAAERIFGYTAQEALGRPVLMFIPPECAEEENEILTKIGRGEIVEHFETVRLRKDGRKANVSVTVSPLRDNSGRIVGAAKTLRDITARKQAEEALRTSEERFRTMANSIPQLGWTARADGSIEWYNERWYEYTGTSLENMQGWGWQTVHDPKVLPKVMENWTGAIRSGEPFEMEFPMRGADGKFRNFLTRVYPLKDAEGRVVQWFGTNTDVDELKQMEESLRASQARLNSTLAAGSIGTWTWDIVNDRLVADEFTARMFSVEPDAAAKGLPAEVYLRAVMEEDQPGVAEGLARAIQSRGYYDIEYRVRQRVGEPRWLQAKGRVEGDAAGTALNFHGAVIDITERKQTDQALRGSEERFRFLNDLSEATRSLADPEQIMAMTARMLGGYIHASRCAYADVGQDGDRVTVLHDYTDGCASMAGNYELSLFGARVVSTLRSGQPLIIRNMEAELLTDEGAAKFNANGIKAMITYPLLKDGGLHALIAVHQTTPRDWKADEITLVQDVVDRCWATIERRTAEEDIRQLNAELEQRVVERTAQLEAANRAKSTFLSTMSHEIRTPMNAILGYSQLLLRDPALGTDARVNLRIINRSGEHLLTLINDVLDMSKIEAGRMELNLTTFRLAGLVDDVAGMSRLRAKAKALQFEVFFDRESEPCVVADEGKIRQVLVNLVANAIKFTQSGEIKLHIALEPGVDNRLWLSARVEDTGSGISAQEQKRLFEPFSRAALGMNNQEGTGLGLAIARKHARLMGGDVTVSSNPGSGSTFNFEIPVARGVTELAGRRAVSPRVIGICAGAERPAILIVDDQIDNRDWLAKLLTVVGFSVRVAHNGEAAIRTWEEWRPQMILMDVQMPVMDGLEATRRIKADPRGSETVIIVLSAGAMNDERRIVLESGADGFLPKPCREDDLLETMRVFLKVVYDYDGTDVAEDELVAGLPVLSAERLGQLPRDVLEDLRDATLNGNKKLLNDLVLKLRKGNDYGCADGVLDLANKYQYQSLAQLLEEACSL